MRRLVLAAALLAACGVPVFFAGCGGGGPGGSALNQALSFLPKDAPFVAAVETDVENGQYRNADRILEKFPFGDQAKQGLERSLEEDGLNFERDIKPVLGNPLVVGAPDVRSFTRDDEQVVAAFQAKDEDKLKEIIEKERGNREVGEKEGATIYRDDEGDFFAIKDDLAVVADERSVLEDAIERSEGDEHMDEDTFEEGLEGLPDDALARVYADLEALLQEDPDTRDARRVKWVDALRTLGLTVAVDRDRLNVEFNLQTESGELSEEDLPIAAGDEAPEVVKRPGEVSLGMRDPSQLVEFAQQAGRAVNPREFGDFERAKRQLNSRLRIDIDRDLIGQLTGDVSTTANVSGAFGTRAEVEDPERFQDTLAKVVRQLPALSQGQVRSVRRRGDLYEAVPARGDSIFFGVVDEVFVASNNAARAARLARESTSAVQGAEGSVVLSADAEKLVDQALQRLAPQIGLGGSLGGQLFTGPLGELTGSVSATTERLRGSLRLGID